MYTISVCLPFTLCRVHISSVSLAQTLTLPCPQAPSAQYDPATRGIPIPTRCGAFPPPNQRTASRSMEPPFSSRPRELFGPPSSHPPRAVPGHRPHSLNASGLNSGSSTASPSMPPPKTAAKKPVTVQDLLGVLHSFVTLNHHREDVLRMLASRLLHAGVQQMTPTETVTAAVGFARMQVCRGSFSTQAGHQ